MVRIARAVVDAGATGVRVNGAEHVVAILAAVSVPVIALNKVDYDDSEVRITPTRRDADALIDAGARIVAIDATSRERPGGEQLVDIIRHLHDHDVTVLADVDTVAAALDAIEAGADGVATTLSGYTANTLGQADGPDLDLVALISARAPTTPLVAEGRYGTRDQIKQALNAGAQAVVVGSAITAPDLITQSLLPVESAS